MFYCEVEFEKFFPAKKYFQKKNIFKSKKCQEILTEKNVAKHTKTGKSAHLSNPIEYEYSCDLYKIEKNPEIFGPKFSFTHSKTTFKRRIFEKKRRLQREQSMTLIFQSSEEKYPKDIIT